MWMAVVLAMSSSEMSAENTGSILRPLLAWLLPWLRPPHVDLIHALVRKTAHLTEYGILAVLWRRAFVRTEVGRPALAGALAWAVSVVCAIVDETHQSMLPSRTGTASDVVLDSIGALTAILLIQVGRWQAVDTLVILMGALSLPRIAHALLAAGRRADTPVALIRWGTTDAQETIVGRLDEIAALADAVRLAPPVVIVVGDVVALRQRLAWLPRESPGALGASLDAEGAEAVERQVREVLLRQR